MDKPFTIVEKIVTELTMIKWPTGLCSYLYKAVTLFTLLVAWVPHLAFASYTFCKNKEFSAFDELDSLKSLSVRQLYLLSMRNENHEKLINILPHLEISNLISAHNLGPAEISQIPQTIKFRLCNKVKSAKNFSSSTTFPTSYIVCTRKGEVSGCNRESLPDYANYYLLYLLLDHERTEEFPITARDLTTMQRLSLTKKDILRFKILRSITWLFELHTSLIDDLGGWSGNFLFSTIATDDGMARTKCIEEYRTYYYLLNELSRLGFLSDLSEIKSIKRGGFLTTHFAVQFQYKGWDLVLDSWQEDGGIPAHLLTVEDWLNEADVKEKELVDPYPLFY